MTCYSYTNSGLLVNNLFIKYHNFAFCSFGLTYSETNKQLCLLKHNIHSLWTEINCRHVCCRVILIFAIVFIVRNKAGRVENEITEVLLRNVKFKKNGLNINVEHDVCNNVFVWKLTLKTRIWLNLTQHPPPLHG